ncbi:hypothetical protein RU87_GL000675 [Lactococcus plantarum]|uniref:Uncharacterized protein n=1 Tax=Pseudolactococcus plantarum TaxID=1365 RepID=A0A2A5S381_9LACT|nr:hypothetical protein RU87_GL000675 [Lactococcus plantarum]
MTGQNIIPIKNKYNFNDTIYLCFIQLFNFIIIYLLLFYKEMTKINVIVVRYGVSVYNARMQKL